MQAVVAAVFVVSAAAGIMAVTRLQSGGSPASASVSHGTLGPTSSPMPSPTVSPTPSATASSSPTATSPPVALPSPAVEPTAAGACRITAYAEIDRDVDGSSVDILSTLEGLCPTHTLTTTVALLTDAGKPVSVEGNPATTSYVCPTDCLPITPGQGYGAVHTGIRPYVWSNWCGGPGLFRASVRMVQNGVATSTTVGIAAPPACTAPGRPSRLTAPPP
jgi:hypothetical protein